MHTIIVLSQKLVIKEAVLYADREIVAAREIAKKIGGSKWIHNNLTHLLLVLAKLARH